MSLMLNWMHAWGYMWACIKDMSGIKVHPHAHQLTGEAPRRLHSTWKLGLGTSAILDKIPESVHRLWPSCSGGISAGWGNGLPNVCQNHDCITGHVSMAVAFPMCKLISIESSSKPHLRNSERMACRAWAQGLPGGRTLHCIWWFRQARHPIHNGIDWLTGLISTPFIYCIRSGSISAYYIINNLVYIFMYP